jgi:thiosulfate/3-mercaptopyruvate sulfurtransferase
MPTPTLPGPLVSAEWLAAHLRDVAVADVRWYLDGRSGQAAYRAGHIPGAVWVDLDADLAAPPGEGLGRHPLPSPEAFATALGRLGLGEDRPIVAYDDAGGSIAARLWWMLRVIGSPAALLDGGLAAWRGPLSVDEPTIVATTRTPSPWPAANVVDTAAVDRLRVEPGHVLLDARAAARYDGRSQQVDPRPGHIPGARSAPWADNLGADGRFLGPAALRSRFAAAGIDDDTSVVASCGSGVTACHDLLALELAGFSRTALYPGSWSAWSSGENRPAALGPQPWPAP